MSRAKSIMFQGTGSGVGKSIVVAAMCRLLSRRGVKVAPFKAQNMALNSFVTGDGKEMGRAQVFQAEACGLLPDVRMNPVLLKPSADARSQVIVMGEPFEHLSARDYYQRSKAHWEVVRKAYDSLSSEYEVIVVEGAGSPAEINLRKTDIVNMTTAEYAGASVLIVADIDRGGVFASLKGTFDLVEERFRPLIKGFIINKFRGDRGLLEPGIEMFFDIVPVPVLGVLPWFHDIHVDEEDGVFVGKIQARSAKRVDALRICVARLPRISNFTDFSALSLEEDVEVVLSEDPRELLSSDIAILPGTKATTSDLLFLKSRGWDRALKKFVERGGIVAGICGGFQMLGLTVSDRLGTDGPPGTYEGFGLLPMDTKMSGKKVLKQLEICIPSPLLHQGEINVTGYEIHMGRSVPRGDISGNLYSVGSGDCHVFVWDGERGILGTYIHGIFDNDLFRRAFLDFARKRKGLEPLSATFNYRDYRLKQFDKLADWLEENSDTEELLRLVDV